MSGKKRFVSSTEVARLAGVSQSAVSRTYNAGASVSETMREKVLVAAAQLGYRPSLIPRIMLTQRSNLVAVVIGGMYNPFYADVLERFTIGLQASGIQVLLVHADSGHMLDGVIPRIISYHVDAVISALSILSAQAADELARLRIPVITFNTPVQRPWITAICCDNVAAGATMAELLAARGARSFGFISGPPDSPASQERLQGFQARLADMGVTPARVGRGDFSYESGDAAVGAMLDRPRPPDAIFCANDLMAIGAIDAARRRGLDVPRDLMIAGFDGIPAAGWAGYDLTTSVQDTAAMTASALDSLRAALSGDSPPDGEHVVIPARLVERGTTRRLRDG